MLDREVPREQALDPRRADRPHPLAQGAAGAVYPGGKQDWAEAGLPVEREETPLA